MREMHIPSALHAYLYKNYPDYQDIQLIKKGDNLFQADLFCFNWNQRKYLVKSYHRWIYFTWITRKLVKREIRFYRLLRGCSFILPVYTVSKDSQAFVIPWISQLSIKKLPAPECEELFHRCEKIIQLVHDQKISHGDIRLKNFLYDGKGLYLIDWVTAIYWNGPFTSKIPGKIQKMFFTTDTYRMLKVFSRLLPSRVSFRPPWWYYPGYFFRRKIYRWFKKE